MRHYNSGDGQEIFNYLWIIMLFVFKWSFKGLIYSPFLYSGYVAAAFLLHKDDSGLLWMAMILLFAGICYLLFFMLEKLMLKLVAKGKLMWIPLFVICLGFTCVLPVWIIFDPLERLIGRLTHHSNASVITWILSLAFGFYISGHYLFSALFIK